MKESINISKERHKSYCQQVTCKLYGFISISSDADAAAHYKGFMIWYFLVLLQCFIHDGKEGTLIGQLNEPAGKIHNGGVYAVSVREWQLCKGVKL